MRYKIRQTTSKGFSVFVFLVLKHPIYKQHDIRSLLFDREATNFIQLP